MHARGGSPRREDRGAGPEIRGNQELQTPVPFVTAPAHGGATAGEDDGGFLRRGRNEVSFPRGVVLVPDERAAAHAGERLRPSRSPRGRLEPEAAA